MHKPTLFISHSSADKDYLRVLRDLIYGKTSGTLEIFLSSDGQSIPFGANWVHTIETALDRASVMFVAVSPRSVDSQWIYFEAGYTYSRKIKVIPVGIMGLSIDRLRPPLSLLQGFNLASHEGLNNLVVIINREYNYSFSDDFSPQDYERLKMAGGAPYGPMQRYVDIVDYLAADLPPKVGTHALAPNLHERLELALNELSLPFYRPDDSTIALHGTRIQIPKDETNPRVSLSLDLLSATHGIPLIRGLFKHLYDAPAESFWFKVFFQPHVRVLTTDFKVSSRLENAGIERHSAGVFGFRGIRFSLDTAYTVGMRGVSSARPYLRVVGEAESQADTPLLSLIDALVEAAVIDPGTQ